ncbi:MAG: class I SAM-dependent methyltransferase [gamma proteobacterium endosymbiont of Lamellibrachia anaximandri]|nr:class I SAM-dependent methyltransferase [gamma proteobacterium endosymbiont of Lamellibrachia anaximandri]MBL3535799.1 class I SAM-dependent methyltransferase [gamma proteobacterium endosymbiont of Lamellibrachia anaximandri]
MKEAIDADKSNLVEQEKHWETMLSSKPDMFGESQSTSASEAAKAFKKEGVSNILELGGGQGRDTIFFAKNGFHVHVLDYSQSGIENIKQKAETKMLSQHITATCHDIRNPLPFENDSLDACYSHMLYCMALTTNELEFLSNEIRRVLKPGGLNIYTVRHTGDADFGTGIHRGEDLYEVGGFIVHFFSKDKIRHLAQGYRIVGIDEFEEGALPRKLFRVTLKKKANST